MDPTLKDSEPRSPALAPEIRTTQEIAESPVPKKGLRKAFGEWLGRGTIGSLFLPFGLWAALGAILGVYGDTAGLWGLNVIMAAAPHPRTLEDDDPRGDPESAWRRIRRLARRAYRLLYLPGAVLMEVCWVHFAMHDAPRWLLPALIAFVGAWTFAGNLLPQRTVEVPTRPRRPALRLAERWAMVVVGLLLVFASIGLAAPFPSVSAIFGILLLVAGLVLVLMGGLGLPTVEYDPAENSGRLFRGLIDPPEP